MHSFIDHHIQTNGINLRFIEYPNAGKPTLILMHGLTANAHAMGGLVNAGLKKHFRLIFPDLRGRGQSDKPAFRYSFRDHALDILGMMDRLGIESCTLGGHSFGGLLSVYLGVHFPRRVERLILLDAAAEMNPNTFEMLGPTLDRLDKVYPSYDAYIEKMKQAPHNTFWAEEMTDYYNADIMVRPDGNYTPIPNLATIYRIISFVATENWKKNFSKISQPTLLVNGVDEYNQGEPILPDFKAKESIKLLQDGHYVKVDGNHQTMLYGSGARQTVESIVDFFAKSSQPQPEVISNKLKVAVVGATGVVGSTMIRLLEERNFPVSELVPVASERSAGSTVLFKGRKYPVVTPEQAIYEGCDIALFSAGGSTSLKYAPLFAEKGTIVIDNSSAWRMDPDKKLIVPEVNGHLLQSEDKIIANPNCSTIQLVIALKPLHDAFRIRRVVVSTYQSVSGSGAKGIEQLQAEQRGEKLKDPVYPFPIHENVLPQIDEFTENGYTKEELKMINETKKIMGDDSIQVTATTVRVPVRVGHSESVNIEFHNDFDIKEVYRIFMEHGGIGLVDNPATKLYPMPLEVEGRDEVFVGRIRRDFSQPNTLNCWIVADNLRKGAATNAIQIAERLIEQNLVGQTV